VQRLVILSLVLSPRVSSNRALSLLLHPFEGCLVSPQKAQGVTAFVGFQTFSQPVPCIQLPTLKRAYRSDGAPDWLLSPNPCGYSTVVYLDGLLVFVHQTLLIRATSVPPKLHSPQGAGQNRCFLLNGGFITVILVSNWQLQPNPIDIANRLLAQITQQLSALSTVMGHPFQCQLLLTNPPSNSHVTMDPEIFEVCERTIWRCETRADPCIFADGAEKFGLEDVIHTLSQMSVLPFFLGLLDFLLNANRILAYGVCGSSFSESW
jgi:hypothetical protein